MANTLNIFLLSFGALQGLLLAILLLRKKAYRGAYEFLIVYLLVLIVQIVLKVSNKTWMIQNIQALYFSSYHLPFLYGPLAYLLVRQLANPEQKISRSDTLHFLPFVAAVAVSISYNYFFFNDLLRFISDPWLTLTLQLLSIGGYHTMAAKNLRESPSDLAAAKGRTNVRWLKTFTILSAISSTGISVGLFVLYISFPHYGEWRWIFSLLTVFIYWLAYEAINQPELFVVIRGGAQNGSSGTADLRLLVGRAHEKYSTSGLKKEDAAMIKTSLDKIIALERPYLDPELDIDGLARRVRCSRHHLSQVINEREGVSFNEFINRLRVTEAQQQLVGTDQKIAAIAFASGFTSLSTFNDVFKRATGVTPSEYRKNELPAFRARKKLL